MKKIKDNIWLGAAIIMSCAFMISPLFFDAGAASSIAEDIEENETDKYPNLYTEPSDFDPDNEKNDKTIYLTFDDGPSKNTEKILDILEDEDVKATFFVTMQLEDKDYIISLMKRMVEEGHTIGLHSEQHDQNKIYKYPEAYMRDIDIVNSFIIENTGYRPKIYRFPGGSKTSCAKCSVIAEIVEELSKRGYKYYDWNVVSGDDRSYVVPAEQLIKNVLCGIKINGYSVVLFHDCPLQKSTPDAVKSIIRSLKELGYKFDSLK